MDKLDSGFKDIQFFVHALGGLKDENAVLKKDLEQPESIQALGADSIVVLDTIRSNQAPNAETERNLAEPISPSNIDESVEHMNASDFNDTVKTLKKLEDTQRPKDNSTKAVTKNGYSTVNQSKQVFI